MQPIEQTFEKLLEKEAYAATLDFLKGLSPAEKKAFVPALKKICKEYLDPLRVEKWNSISFTSKANERQRFILDAAAFCCCNRQDFEKMNGGWHILRDRKADDILPWYCPTWFSDFVNGAGKGNRPIYGLTYTYLVELEEKQYITPVPELVVQVLPQSIFEYNNKGKKYDEHFEVLMQYPVTLEKHIWYLFEYPSNIKWSGHFIYRESKAGEVNGWHKVFATFAAQGKLSRERILKEALLANTRNFDKNLSGWFIELVTLMQPADEEIVNLQDELFAVMQCVNSKAVNSVLQYFKKIAADKRFDTGRFLETVATLLVSDTKSIVSSCLILVEKIARQQPAANDDICGLVCHAFIHKDDALQTKAAAIIKKLKLTSPGILQENIAPYTTTLLVKTKELLQGLLTEETRASVAVLQIDHTENTPAQLPPITYPSNVEDLIFLASQAFDNNEPWHVDVLPAVLISLHQQVLQTDLTRFEAALQRAYKLTAGDYQGPQGYLDNLAATFFIAYCNLLIEIVPQKAQGLKRVEDLHYKKELEKKQKWAAHTIRVPNLKNWKVKSGQEIYQVHRHIMQLAMEKLQAGSSLPLLSTPTHEPAWVSPRRLVDRIFLYRQAGQPVDDVDMQVAITRCRLDEEDAAQYAAQKLDGEISALVQFVLLKDTAPPATMQHPSLWMAAALAKAPAQLYPELQPYMFNNIPREKLTGQFAWQPDTEQYTERKWDPVQKKTIQVPAQQAVLKIYIAEPTAKHEQALHGIKKFIGRLIGKTGITMPAAIKNEPLIYEFEKIHGQFFIISENDVERLLYLFANNPEPLLGQITKEALKHAAFYSETDKKIVTSALKALHHLWKPGMGEMAHFFLAACMLTNDKTAAALAAEIWLQGVKNKSVNSTMIGRTCGMLLLGELAPLKRFTDLLEQYIPGVSHAQNTVMLELITALLGALPYAPVKGLKKLLEIFLEILALNNEAAGDNALTAKLTQWKQTDSLAKLVTSIERRVGTS